MEIYPSIDTLVTNTPIIAFDKLDGSNIRAEWNRKTGFTKFGTRRRLLDPHEAPLGEAVNLILENYADDLDSIFREARYEKTTAFFEFADPGSFAGFHAQEAHSVTLFDVHLYKQGLLPAKDFLKLCGDKVITAPVLYTGMANQEFLESVRDGSLPGMTFEGVVCKGGLDNRRRPIAFKVKNRAWLDKLKTKCGSDEKMFEKLK